MAEGSSLLRQAELGLSYAHRRFATVGGTATSSRLVTSEALKQAYNSANGMNRSGIADLPLHGGSVPRWLAERMTKLGTAIAESVVHHYGASELLSRLADPFWFQALGCVMGMDWHSSGITTSVVGALKRGLNSRTSELGICVWGAEAGIRAKLRANYFATHSGQISTAIHWYAPAASPREWTTTPLQMDSSFISIASS